MGKRTYEFVQLDVFTRTPLTGNPLAVFTDARGLIDKEMQALAREKNLSESWQRQYPDSASSDGTTKKKALTLRLDGFKPSIFSPVHPVSIFSSLGKFCWPGR